MSEQDVSEPNDLSGVADGDEVPPSEEEVTQEPSLEDDPGEPEE